MPPWVSGQNSTSIFLFIPLALLFNARAQLCGCWGCHPHSLFQKMKTLSLKIPKQDLLYFWKGGLLPGTHYVAPAVPSLQRSSCLCLLSGGVLGMSRHAQLIVSLPRPTLPSSGFRSTERSRKEHDPLLPCSWLYVLWATRSQGQLTVPSDSLERLFHESF